MDTKFQMRNQLMGELAVASVILLLLVVVQPIRTQEDSTHSLIAFTSGGQIHSMTSDGNNVHLITTVFANSPAWSPDGMQLTFITREYDGVSQVAITNVDSDSPLQLTSDRLDDKFSPMWSPDGDWIVFTFGRVEQRDVYLIRPDGSELTNLTNTPNKDEYVLDWSPDGQHLLIRIVDGADSSIYLMNRDGTGLNRQTQFLPETYSVQWSPNSQSFAFSSDYGAQEDHSDVYVMKADGSDLTNLTESEANDFGPTWSPDGNYLAFASDRTGDYEIYRMRADGTAVINLSNNPESDDWFPSWSPALLRPAPTTAPPTLTPIPVTLTPSVLECPDAPPSRLNLGMSAAVVLPTEEEPERQNLRVRDAVEGEPIGLLEPGTEFRIVGGPECGANGQRWWEVETLDGAMRGWSVEGFAPDDYLMVPF